MASPRPGAGRHCRLFSCLAWLWPTIACADLLGMSNPAEIADWKGARPYVGGGIFAASDDVAAMQFSRNWNGPFTPKTGGNLSIAEGRIETGFAWDSWRFSTLLREEAIVDTNADTAAIYRDNKQHLSVPQGRSFLVKLGMEGFEAKGLRLDKGFLVELGNGTSLRIGGGFSLLDGMRVRIAGANGTAASTSTGYAYNVTLQDQNSRGSYPFISSAIPSGRGYSTDVGAILSLPGGGRVDFAANDLVARMHWYNMPYTFETANSNTVTRDASGYISYNAVLNGYNDLRRRTVVQKIPPKYHLDYLAHFRGFDLSAGADRVWGYWLPQAGMSLRLYGNWRLDLDRDFRFGSNGVAVSSRYVHFGIRSGSLDMNQSRALGLSAGLSFPF